MSEIRIKKYPLTENIVKMWIEYQALLNLRDLYILRPFGCGYKKARKAAIEAEGLKNKASKMIVELYPELDRDKRWDICDLKFEPYLKVE